MHCQGASRCPTTISRPTFRISLSDSAGSKTWDGKSSYGRTSSSKPADGYRCHSLQFWPPISAARIAVFFGSGMGTRITPIAQDGPAHAAAFCASPIRHELPHKIDVIHPQLWNSILGGNEEYEREHTTTSSFGPASVRDVRAGSLGVGRHIHG